MKKKSLKTAALQYAELSNFSVIPVGLDKRPLLRSWKEYQDRKATQEEIERWWQQFPDANIGIVTGKISGITVIDIDTHKGADASVFPHTYTVQTGNGGIQLYYEYQEGLTVSANAYPNLPHVDIRNDTGYVVAPPSVTDYIDKGIKKGGRYTILKSGLFAPFPAHLFPQSKKSHTLPELVKVTTGSRNSSMASVIGTLLHPLHESKFLTDGWNAVMAVNETYKPPLDYKELQTTFNSIVKKELQRRSDRNKTSEDIDLLYGFNAKGEKMFYQNTENMCRVLRKHQDFAGRFKYDIFKNLYQLRLGSEDFSWRQIEDNDAVNIQTSISILFPAFAKVGKEMIYDAVIKVCKENKYDSAADYIKSLVWDHIPRLDSWIGRVYGTPDDEYHRAVGSNWIKGMIKRLIEPGSKFDYVLVLEGKQGIKKSTSLYILGADWYTETAMATDNKDFFMQFAGKSIIEFSEGETLSRTEVKRMKAIITMQSDRFRPPYERTTQDFPRRCVFAMTTNQEEYLKDETGNRRWLPVAVVKDADVEWLAQNREQLFAEAYDRVFNKKETVYDFPAEVTEAAQDARRIKDPNEDLIANWYFSTLDKAKREAGITVYQVYRDALYGYQPSKIMSKYDEFSITMVLKKHLKLKKDRISQNGLRTVKWFNPNKEIEVIDDILTTAFKQLES